MVMAIVHHNFKQHPEHLSCDPHATTRQVPGHRMEIIRKTSMLNQIGSIRQ